MDHSPQEARLLTQVLPNVAAQFRTTLGNMHAALSSGDDPDACILRQSYYRLLRTVTNLTDAVMLAEDTPLPRQDKAETPPLSQSIISMLSFSSLALVFRHRQWQPWQRAPTLWRW